MRTYKQTREELLAKLREQINLIERSAKSFDDGREEEALHLAVSLRILVHDSENKSLLNLLGKKNIPFYDSSGPYGQNSSKQYSNLTSCKLSTRDGATYQARLDDGTLINRTKKVEFSEWWDGIPIIKDKDGNTYTRKDLVLNVANTDGGAHVDENLHEDYANLARGKSRIYGFFKKGQDDFVNKPVLPSIRTISQEVMKTLKDEFPELF